MSDHGIHALDELRESLREAARRDIAARPRRRRSGRRLGGLAAVLVVALGGAAATAANLISEGRPVDDERQAAIPAKYRPTNAGGRLAVEASDKPLNWGVEVYTSNAGKSCAVVGRVRGYALGEVSGTQFHAFPPGRAGQCASSRTDAVRTVSPAWRENRTLYYGLVAPGVKKVTVKVDGTPHTASTGLDGAFLFVFKGRVAPGSFSAVSVG